MPSVIAPELWRSCSAPSYYSPENPCHDFQPITILVNWRGWQPRFPRYLMSTEPLSNQYWLDRVRYGVAILGRRASLSQLSESRYEELATSACIQSFRIGLLREFNRATSSPSDGLLCDSRCARKPLKPANFRNITSDVVATRVRQLYPSSLTF